MRAWRQHPPQRVRMWHITLLYYCLATLCGARAEVYGDGKDTPAKGSLTCPDSPETARYDFSNVDAFSIWLKPNPDDSTPPPDLPQNGIVLQVFASLPTFGPDLGNIFTWAIVGYLNEAASLQYDVKLNSTNTSIYDFFNATDRRPHSSFGAEVVLQHTTTEKIECAEGWWWQYNLTFHCFWGGVNPPKSGPLMEKATLQKIERELNKFLREGVATVNLFDFLELSNKVLGLSVDDPRVTRGFKDLPSTQPPTSAPTEFLTASPTVADKNGVPEKIVDPTYMTPIDAQSWDWRRYLGLSIFLGTLVGTVLLTQMADYRQRQRVKRKLWGNLGTEEGVNALLNTGWIVKGSKMEVYDKAGLGYRDDDSMLIGGFEESAYMGAELNVTQDSKSATTPDIHTSCSYSGAPLT